MPYKPLLRILEERRSKLVETLRGFDRKTQLERQHQLYGAIQELDVVLRTIQAQAKQIQQTAAEMSAEKLINESIDMEKKRLDTTYKDLRTPQYHVNVQNPDQNLK